MPDRDAPLMRVLVVYAPESDADAAVGCALSGNTVVVVKRNREIELVSLAYTKVAVEKRHRQSFADGDVATCACVFPHRPEGLIGMRSGAIYRFSDNGVLTSWNAHGSAVKSLQLIADDTHRSMCLLSIATAGDAMVWKFGAGFASAPSSPAGAHPAEQRPESRRFPNRAHLGTLHSSDTIVRTVAGDSTLFAEGVDGTKIEAPLNLPGTFDKSRCIDSWGGNVVVGRGKCVYHADFHSRTVTLVNEHRSNVTAVALRGPVVVSCSDDGEVHCCSTKGQLFAVGGTDMSKPKFISVNWERMIAVVGDAMGNVVVVELPAFAQRVPNFPTDYAQEAVLRHLLSLEEDVAKVNLVENSAACILSRFAVPEAAEKYCGASFLLP